jgi:predicted nucleotidyltransferase
MKKKLTDLSARIDPETAEILAIISHSAERNNIPFFMVGATARDLFFKSRRATIDLDLGIQIATWQLYDTLFEELVKTGHFRKSGTVHRLHFIKSDFEFPVDIVPFGCISEANGIISWPDKKQMSILGFEEAYQDSYTVKIGESIEKTIQIASPVGLVIMKLIAWSESTDRAEKDAQDLELMFSDYHAIFDNSERMFDYPEIMNVTGFDLQRSGTVLLGKDAASILKENETGKVIRSIIGNELNTSKSKLAIDMMAKNRFSENEFDMKLQMIRDFETGLHFK